MVDDGNGGECCGELFCGSESRDRGRVWGGVSFLVVLEVGVAFGVGWKWGSCLGWGRPASRESHVLFCDPCSGFEMAQDRSGRLDRCVLPNTTSVSQSFSQVNGN